MPDQEKYIVFKREELYKFLGEVALPSGNEDCAPVAAMLVSRVDEVKVPDAVVIRRQDVFAPPALDAYSNSITVAVQAMDNAAMVNKDVVDSLRVIADYFHEEAALAWQSERKLPD